MRKTVKEIFEMINNKELYYDQTTQRQFIYSNMTIQTEDGDISKAGNVIRSILQEKIQLPALFFWKRDDGKYNIHDGKQRILSLYYFCNPLNSENIQVTTKINGQEYSFNNLQKDWQDELLNYKFDIVVKEGNRELEEKSFDLINTNSVPLTEYECIRGLMYGKWFKGFEDFICQQGKILDNVPSEIGRGDRAIYFLRAYFNELKPSSNSWNITIRYNLNINRNNSFDCNANDFQRVIEIYNQIAQASKCDIQICLQIAQFIQKDKWNIKNIIEYYQLGIKETNDIKKWKIDAHYIAIANLMYRNIKCDYRRFFDKKDKSVLFNQKGKCWFEGCNVDTYDDLQVDHIKPWSEGGKTNLKNAQLLCKQHNASKKDLNYKDWKGNNVNKALAKNVNVESMSYVDAWNAFEKLAKKINDFSFEKVQNNSRINVERINDVSKKINLSEVESALLHDVRKKRNAISHRDEATIIISTILNDIDQKAFNSIIKKMEEYIESNKK